MEISSRPNISVSENYELGFYSPYIHIIDKYVNPLTPKSPYYAIIIGVFVLVLLLFCIWFLSSTTNFKIFEIDKNQTENSKIEVLSKNVKSVYNSNAPTSIYTFTCIGTLLYSILYLSILGYYYSKFCIRFASLNFFQPFSILLSLIFYLFLFIINIVFLISLLNPSDIIIDNNIKKRQFGGPKEKDIALYLNICISIFFLICLGLRSFRFKGFNFGK